MGCLAATAFFFLERGSVAAAWRVSITVAGLVTGIAFIHYMYMREVWIGTGESPTVYRYIDWLITVPLLMLRILFCSSSSKKSTLEVFWRLVNWYFSNAYRWILRRSRIHQPTLGFVIGMAGWIYILYEVFSGEAGKLAAKSGNKLL